MRIRSLFCPFLGAAGHLCGQGLPFQPPPDMIPNELLAEQSAAAGDLDLDGDVDLVLLDGQRFPVFELGPTRIRIWWNEGAERYREERNVLLHASWPPRARALLVDLDRDGDPDLITGGSPLQVWVNQFPGPFVEAATGLPLEAPDTRDLVAADFDLDGATDVFLAVAGADRFYLGERSYPWRFRDASGALPPDTDPSDAALAGDWNGDGWPDLAILGAGQLRILHWTPGTILFALAQELPFAAGTCLAAGDADRDGDLDLLGGRDGADHLLLNDGSGRFLPAAGRLPAHEAFTAGAGFADVDRDGDLDLVLAHRGDVHEDGWNRLLLNDGGGRFLEEQRLGDGPIQNQGLLAEDLDRDGDTDLLFLSDRRSRTTLLLGDGRGGFASTRPTLPPQAIEGTTIALAELDDTPGLDAVVLGEAALAHPRRGGLELLFNDGSGRFLRREGMVPADIPEHGAGVSAADFDGDGHADLFLQAGPWQAADGAYYLLFNDGSGRFRDASANLPALDWIATAFAAGDLDADGDADLLLGTNSGERRAGLLLNRGDGTFVDASASLPLWPWTFTAHLELADLDRDGDLDIFAGRHASSSATGDLGVFLNDGRAGFVELNDAVFAAQNNRVEFWRLGDCDGDGDPDLVLCHELGRDFRLLPNDDNGRFGPPLLHALPQLEVVGIRDLEFGDLDGDGDLDLAFCDRYRSSPLMRNDGQGHFALDATSPPMQPDGYYYSDLALGDLDEDDDVDWFAAGLDFLQPLLNLDRQVRWRALPRVGRPLEIEVHGTAGGFYWLFASAGTIDRPTPYGRLRVDPRALTGLRSGRLDAGGAAVEATLIPANPALVGTRFYLQALLDSPLRLSNLEVAELEGS